MGLADLEDWAKHMPISHHRNGLRQAVHSVAGGLRSQVIKVRVSVFFFVVFFFLLLYFPFVWLLNSVPGDCALCMHHFEF